MHHVAILNKSWNLLPKIISGEKTIESRWYKSRFAPWDRIKAGDLVYFKDSGEPVSAVAEVEKVLQFEDLDEFKFNEIAYSYGDRICLPTREYSDYFRSKNYCILVFLKNVNKLKEPFEIDKFGYGMSAAWLCMDHIDEIRLEDGWNVLSGTMLRYKHIKFPEPIFKHKEWLHLKSPERGRVRSFLADLRKHLGVVDRIARERGLKQIRINIDLSAAEGCEFDTVAYQLEAKVDEIVARSESEGDVVELRDVSEASELIQDQFQLHFEFNPEFYTNEVDTSVRDFIKISSSKIAVGEAAMLGVKIGGQLVAISYCTFKKWGGFIEELFVVGRYRGGGFGRRLVEESARRCKKRNLSQLGLYSRNDPGTLSFYEKVGMKRAHKVWVRFVD